MVVVILTAGGALLALRLYKTTPNVDTVLFGVQQSAGVMAAICAAIFAVITALRTGKPPGMGAITGAVAPPGMPPTFGRPAGLLSGAPATV